MTAPCGFVCSWARFVGLASTLVASHNDIPWLLRRGFQPKRETTRSFVRSLSLLRTKRPSDFRSEIVLHWSVWESHRGLPRENDASRKWHAPDQHESYPNLESPSRYCHNAWQQVMMKTTYRPGLCLSSSR
ncbi:hypothetical protein HDK90DRAFT_182470 [Phyllosticta capitalensis]|uniref:Secreted protein n=1 Tax=Phyllosticta capitalensis TaxID=121624 RepID=A0ABR1YX04_9PEZI